MAPVIREFDGKALYAALDAKRRAEALSWTGAASAIWDMAPALNAARDARGLANHPISPSTLQSLDKRANTSCQHALFFLRWLDRTPESFLVGAALDAGAPLPPCGPDRRPRWDAPRRYMRGPRRNRGLNDDAPDATSADVAGCAAHSSHRTPSENYCTHTSRCRRSARRSRAGPRLRAHQRAKYMKSAAGRSTHCVMRIARPMPVA